MDYRERFKTDADTHMNGLSADKFQVQNILGTMKDTYIAGCENTDDLYREAFKQFCEENGFVFSVIFPKFLLCINNVSLNKTE